jgi:hypothetical protein
MDEIILLELFLVHLKASLVLYKLFNTLGCSAYLKDLSRKRRSEGIHCLWNSRSP